MTGRAPGRLLGGRYRLRERIDEGGAGEVWLGYDERLGRDVAVKLLGEEADAAFRQRFTDEARRAAAIAHPNVVTVFDQGEDGPDAYMVMEHVRGRTLREIVAERGALAPREASRIVSQIAGALDAAHDAGLLHCDVKPTNVILDERGIAKLADFGVARAARGPAEHELVATPRYIAPERVEGKEPTAASDVYGLGLVAYELLAGRTAFDGADTDDLLRERLEGPPPSLRRARSDLEPGLDLAVAKALARDPARRYQRAGDFARDLAAAARGEATQTMRVVTPAVRPLRRERGAPRIDTLVALLAVALIVVAATVLFVQFPDLPGVVGGPTPTASARVTPNVAGKDVGEAARTLLAAGFRDDQGRQQIPWEMVSGASGRPCSVVRQQPEPGTSYQPGSAAKLFIVPGDCR